MGRRLWDPPRTVVGDLIKRLVNLVVVALAAVTFFCVPLGNKTLFRHLCAIFSTPAAEELGRDIKKTSDQVVDEVKKSVPDSGH
ncbi:MAG: hypothetical protein ACXVEF_10145 [Polyangiales bacterium]